MFNNLINPKEKIEKQIIKVDYIKKWLQEKLLVHHAKIQRNNTAVELLKIENKDSSEIKTLTSYIKREIEDARSCEFWIDDCNRYLNVLNTQLEIKNILARIKDLTNEAAKNNSSAFYQSTAYNCNIHGLEDSQRQAHDDITKMYDKVEMLKNKLANMDNILPPAIFSVRDNSQSL